MKTQNFEKMNKIAGDIITLHMCTKNLHHMKHSPEMQNETVSHFGPFFALVPSDFFLGFNVFYKKVVFRNFRKFTKKHLC